MNLIFEPICAGNFLLFVLLTPSALQPRHNYRASPAAGSAAPVCSTNHSAGHEEKKALMPAFVSLSDIGYLQRLHFSVELEFPSDMWKSVARAVPSLLPERAGLLPRGGIPSPCSPRGHIAHHCFHPFPNIMSLSWSCGGSRGIIKQGLPGRKEGCGGGERGQPCPAPCSYLWLCPQQTPV